MRCRAPRASRASRWVTRPAVVTAHAASARPLGSGATLAHHGGDPSTTWCPPAPTKAPGCCSAPPASEGEELPREVPAHRAGETLAADQVSSRPAARATVAPHRAERPPATEARRARGLRPLERHGAGVRPHRCAVRLLLASNA